MADAKFAVCRVQDVQALMSHPPEQPYLLRGRSHKPGLIRADDRRAHDAMIRVVETHSTNWALREAAVALDIRQATTRQELDDTRALMRAFVGWHRARHTNDIALIDSYFNEAEFSAELAGLPGKYALPEGSLRLAYLDGKAAGCVALHDLGEGFCEMKRMYVPEEFRGKGVGRGLAEQIIADAKASCYSIMRLDTSHRQTEAMRLYRNVGFLRIEPYYPMQQVLADWLVLFELKL